MDDNASLTPMQQDQPG
jgi:hypothetical protein